MTTPAPHWVVGPTVDAAAASVHDAALFVGRFFVEVVQPPYNVRELVEQCWLLGLRSLPLVTLTGLVTGLVFTKQSRPSLAAFGATSWLPSLVTIALVRSLAPLVTALICAGKVGSGIGAELGSMKVTEQLEAMEVSGIDPYRHLVVTRALATALVLPVLVVYCSAVGLGGSYFDIVRNESTSFVAFLEDGFATLTFLDLAASLGKSVLFGFSIGIIACFQGFHATRGTVGVGRAANAAVVLGMVVVLLEEVLVVQVIHWVRAW